MYHGTAAGRRLDGKCGYFKLYRVVNLGETNNGIFGLDEAFLNEGNVGPELNIEPFPVCKSPYYVQALSDIVGYLGELKQKSKDPGEKVRIENRREVLQQAMQQAIGEKRNFLGDLQVEWKGECVMELLEQTEIGTEKKDPIHQFKVCPGSDYESRR